MVGYRCYILDAEDHIVQAHNLDCDSDMQAQTEAENFLSQDPVPQLRRSLAGNPQGREAGTPGRIVSSHCDTAVPSGTDRELHKPSHSLHLPSGSDDDVQPLVTTSSRFPPPAARERGIACTGPIAKPVDLA